MRRLVLAKHWLVPGGVLGCLSADVSLTRHGAAAAGLPERFKERFGWTIICLLEGARIVLCRPDPTDCDALIKGLLPAVLEAARLEMAHFTAGVGIEKKADNSPVTIADREAEGLLLKALAATAPGIPVVAEEAASAGHIPPPASEFFLVDALDGTRLFVRGKPEFSINIALVRDTRPVFGLIFVPPTGRLYVTRSDGGSYTATLNALVPAPQFDKIDFTRLATRAPDRENLVAFNSQSAGGASAELLAALGVQHARPMGSSIKFCMLAAGEGDIYARLGDTNEWDTAAGQAILEAAGGSVTTIDGRSMTYGHAENGYLNPHFVAWGRTPLLTGFGGTAPAKKGL